MNAVFKAELKRVTAGQIGNKMEDMLESAQNDLLRFEGGVAALGAASKNIEKLHGFLEKDEEEGLIEDKMSLIEVRKLLKKYINRAKGICESSITTAEIMKAQTHGRVTMAKSAVTYVKGIFDEQTKKIEGIQQALKSGDLVTEDNVVSIDEDKRKQRPEGTHPGKTIKERRQEASGGE